MDEAVLNQTIVIDNGTGFIKAGFAGDTKPPCVLPSYIGKPKYDRCHGIGKEGDVFVGHSATDKRGLLRLEYPIEHGVIKDWEGIELLWGAVYQELNAPKSEHPVLLTEAPLNPRQNREKMLEVFLETFNAPAFFVSTQAILALYTSGRTSGVVLDVGAGVSHVVPVMQGFALTHSIKRADIAGRDVTHFLCTLLRRAGQVFQTTAEMEIVRDIKEAACFVNYTPTKDESIRDNYLAIDKGATARGGGADSATSTMYSYQLPDGSQISIGPERSRAPEILFSPSIIGLEYPGVHQLLSASILRTDIDLRRELVSQIVLSGGSTLYAGFVDRLLTELRRAQPKDSLIRVYAPPERQLATFAGGSILGSLTTFKQLWITRSQYEEEGASIIFRKTL